MTFLKAIIMCGLWKYLEKKFVILSLTRFSAKYEPVSVTSLNNSNIDRMIVPPMNSFSPKDLCLLKIGKLGDHIHTYFIITISYTNEILKPRNRSL